VILGVKIINSHGIFEPAPKKKMNCQKWNKLGNIFRHFYFSFNSQNTYFLAFGLMGKNKK